MDLKNRKVVAVILLIAIPVFWFGLVLNRQLPGTPKTVEFKILAFETVYLNGRVHCVAKMPDRWHESKTIDLYLTGKIDYESLDLGRYRAVVRTSWFPYHWRVLKMKAVKNTFSSWEFD